MKYVVTNEWVTMVKNNFFSRIAAGCVLAFAVVTISCEQYEYDSPLPGIIEVRLAVKNERTSLLPFSAINPVTGAQNIFMLVLDDLEVLQPGNIRLPVYSSLAAIRRPDEGDFFNSLDVAARDSNLVLGVAYAPPGTFSRVNVRVAPQPVILISYGFYEAPIFVEPRLPIQDLQSLPETGELSIPVTEGRVTRITVTFDMDRSLIQLAETFEYVPYYYISSVEQL
ncbi:MAG: hypothetical protein ACKVRP_04705 [Bacteroidota bacterium]